MSIICCNWKMNGSVELLNQYAKSLPVSEHQLVLLPPTPLINAAIKILPKEWAVGAQACHAESHGAYTGMVSSELLAEVGAKYVLVGHSERRAFEDESFLSSAFYKAEAMQIQPILCVGETWDERSQVYEVLTKQLALLKLAKLPEIWVAYEPRWAIGTGKTPEVSEVEVIFSWLRQEIQGLSPRQSDKIRLLYGGSVGVNNFQEFFSSKNIDGGLIGGASLKLEQIREMLL